MLDKSCLRLFWCPTKCVVSGVGVAWVGLMAWTGGGLASAHSSSEAGLAWGGGAPWTLVQGQPGAPEPVPLPKPGKPPQIAPDEQNPLTPDIRPRGSENTPDLRPQTPPDRKAEPSTPRQKDAQPAPGVVPNRTPKSQPDQGLPGNKSASKAPAVKPGLAVAQPRSAAEREKALADLYAHLAAADDAKQAQSISGSIERLWVTSGSDTVGLLMQRALLAANGKNPQLALKLLDAVVALAPDYAEAWNRRAYVHYTQNEVDLALGDLRRTLALDPNHFKALEGLMHILKDIGRKKDALQAARKLLDVNPYQEDAKRIVDELSREIEGRGI